MRKVILVSMALASSIALSGCNSNNPQDRAVGGALIGGAAGTAIGAATTGKFGGALAGGVIGAAGGAIIGGATAPQRSCARIGYDRYGNEYCRAYYQ